MQRLEVHPVAAGERLDGDPILTPFFPLGSLLAYARRHEGGALASRFAIGRVTPLDRRELESLLGAASRREGGVYLFSSYVWNHATNDRLAREVRRRDPEALLVLGGPHVPRREADLARFAEVHPAFDVFARGEGERTLAELLAAVADAGVARAADLRAVRGLTFRTADGGSVRTGDRPRAADLEAFPSPYTTGEFDHWVARLRYMPVETNRGCPYGCSFCDWGAATLSKVHRMSLERVFAEIEYAGRHGVPLVGFCDANFGILPRDVEIARQLVRVREKTGHPQEVGYTNAKVVRPWLLDIYRLLRDAGLLRFAQISLQTTDDGVLRNVDRANIRTDEYEKLIAFFRAERIPASSDMMIGLPGQTPRTLAVDLQFLFDRKVLPVVFTTLVMPNAPMSTPEYRERFGLVVDDDGFVLAAASFDAATYWRMVELALAYKLFVNAGVLKYVLYFMQVDRGVPAVAFVDAWLEATAGEGDGAPLGSEVRRALLERQWRPGARDGLLLHWDDAQGAVLFDRFPDFVREVLDLYADRFGVKADGDDVDAIARAQAEVMPRKGRAGGVPLAVPCDVVAWWRDVEALASAREPGAAFVPLRLRAPGMLDATASPPCTDYAFLDRGFASGCTLERHSPLGA